MSKNNYQSIDNNCVCDGYGCDSKAISELQIKVGETRTIFLSLCENELLLKEHILKGNEFAYKKEYEKSIECYDKALEIDPKYTESTLTKPWR